VLILLPLLMVYFGKRLMRRIDKSDIESIIERNKRHRG
jgi:hypothetical protein